MTADRYPVLEIVDGELHVTEVPDGVVLTDADIAALRAHLDALQAVVEVFGAGIRVVQFAGPDVWAPPGRIVPKDPLDAPDEES